MRTRSQSASISSAMISGNAVIVPCPISAAGFKIRTLPSVLIFTHGPTKVSAKPEPSNLLTVMPVAPTTMASDKPEPAVFRNALLEKGAGTLSI